MKLLILLSVVLPKPQAYLDPGSGSILLQLLIAAGAGLLIAARIYWRKIKALFTGKSEEKETPDFLIDEDEQQNNE